MAFRWKSDLREMLHRVGNVFVCKKDLGKKLPKLEQRVGKLVFTLTFFIFITEEILHYFDTVGPEPWNLC
jgi:hypothetical protein